MLALLSAVLIAQASPAPSATPQPLFASPAGWQRVEAEKWQNLSTQNGYETFQVAEAPAAGQSVDALVHSYAGVLHGTRRDVGVNDVALCNGAQGRMLEFVWTDSNNVSRDVHVIAAENGPQGFVAWYERHASAHDSPEAIAALESLCPTGVNATPTPIGLYVLKPPTTWEQQPGAPTDAAAGLQLLGMYFGPTVDGFREQMNVIRAPLPNPDETVEQRAKESSDFLVTQGGTLVSSHARKLCNGTRDGWQLEMTRTTPERKLSFVQVLLLDAGFEYIATYSRPFDAPADPLAAGALDTLCPLAPSV